MYESQVEILHDTVVSDNLGKGSTCAFPSTAVNGNIANMIPVLIEMGVNIINPIETCGGQQNIYDIKCKYGDRIALCGNIDINGVLLNGTVEQVKSDVAKHIEGLADGGGYIVASSHDIHELIPIENFYAMRDAVHEYKFK